MELPASLGQSQVVKLTMLNEGGGGGGSGRGNYERCLMNMLAGAGTGTAR